MAESCDPLAALAALERRYDGPIPTAERRQARLGAAAEIIAAEGQAAFFKSMVLGQLAIIRRRRADGTAYPGLLDDLALYRRGWRRWRRLAEALRAVDDAPPLRLAAE